MERGNQYCCLVLSGYNTGTALPLTQNAEMEILAAEGQEKAVSMICSRFIDCIILQTNEEPESVCNNYRVFSVHFPAIPILVILDEHNIDLACRLGRMGAKYVTSCTDTKRMGNLLQQLIKRRRLRGGGSTLFPDTSTARVGINEKGFGFT